MLFVLESLAGGGAEKVLTTMIKNLDKDKFDVTVLLIVHTGIYVEEVEKYCQVQYMLEDYPKINGIISKIKYHWQYKKIYSQPVEKIYQRYIKDKYDIEIAFLEGFATKLVAASNNTESKKVCWIHTDMEMNPYADRYYKSIEEEREVYTKFDSIIAVSQSVKDSFERKFSFKNMVKVIYNPIDKEIIEKKARNKYAMCNIEKSITELNLITIGRLEKPKGYDRLIKILGALKEYKGSYILNILGDGTEKDNLEKIIQDNGLENQVFLRGFQKNPYVWILQADAFICSSYSEGFSMVATESIILGKPVFTVDCAGMRELISDSKCGVIVPNTDQDLYKLLRGIFRKEYDLKKYQIAAEERSKKFSLQETMRELEELFLNW